MKRLSLVAVLATLIFSALPVMAQSSTESAMAPSNFNYNSVGFFLGQATLDTPVVIAGDRYEDLGAADFFLRGQLAGNLALGASVGVIANEGDRSELTTTTLNGFAEIPIPVGERVDLVPRIGLVRTNAEVCAGGFCQDNDESGAGYGLKTRIWVAPDDLELLAEYSDTTIENSESTINVGVAGWVGVENNHRLAVTYSDNDGLSAVRAGYSYNW